MIQHADVDDDDDIVVDWDSSLVFHLHPEQKKIIPYSKYSKFFLSWMSHMEYIHDELDMLD